MANLETTKFYIMGKIQNFSITSLRVEEDFGFQLRILKYCEYLPKENDGSPEDGASPVLTVAMEKFTGSLQKFDVTLKESHIVSGVKKAADGNILRNKWWRCSNNYVNDMCFHPDTSVAEIAKECKAIFDKYGNPTNLSQTQESGILHNLFQDIEKLTTEKLEKIHFTEWFAAMKQSEQDFLDAVDERAAQEGIRQTGIIQEARDAADTAYRLLISTVNLLAEIGDPQPYADFINSVNALIARQKTVLKIRETNSKREEGTDIENPGGGSGSGSDNPGYEPILPPEDDNNEGEEPETPGGGSTEEPGGSSTGGNTEEPETPGGGEEEEDNPSGPGIPNP